MSLPLELDFDKDREASSARMNRAMEYLYLRLNAATALQPEFQTAIAQLQAVGLDRLNEVLGPMLSDAANIQQQLDAIRASWLSGEPLQGLLDGLADDVTARLAGNAAEVGAVIDQGKADIALQVQAAQAAVAAAGQAAAAAPSRGRLAIILGTIV